MFHVIEKYRIQNSPIEKLNSTEQDGNNGFFMIPNKPLMFRCMVSDGMGWEHVSVSVLKPVKSSFRQLQRCPTWDEMCFIKDMFWDKDDPVIQYHPPESLYVNMHPYVLHLWRPINFKVPVPDPILVGIK